MRLILIMTNWIISRNSVGEVLKYLEVAESIFRKFKEAIRFQIYWRMLGLSPLYWRSERISARVREELVLENINQAISGAFSSPLKKSKWKIKNLVLPSLNRINSKGGQPTRELN